MAQSIVLSYFFVLVLTNLNEILCSKCVVVAPRSLRSNSDYSMSIALHNATGPMQFRVKIYEREEPSTNKTLDYRLSKANAKQDPSDSAVKKGPKPKLMKMSVEDKCSTDVKVPVTGSKTKTITVQPNEPQIIKFKYDTIDILPGSYVLEVVSQDSSAASAFYEKQFLSVESETFSILIHTNKASYRPGDLLKYRIVVVDSDTRPVAISSGLTISVFDSSKTLVHKKVKQSAKKGVYSGDYQTPVRGKKGVWEIEAEYKDKRIRKKFEVTKVERPNFQVISRTPTFVSNTSTQFSVSLECYYTFGKPVTGAAVIKATPILQSNSSWTETAKPVTITKDVRGTYLATFLMSSFKIPQTRTCDSFLIETTLQEKATGAVVRAFDKTIPMDYKKIPSKYDILLFYFGFFLAGELYSIKVQVRAKNGAALPVDLQTAKLAVAFDSDVTETTAFTSMDLDANGKAEFGVQIPVGAVKINFKVKHGESFEEATVLAKKLHVQVFNPGTPKLNQKLQFQVGCQDLVNKIFYYIVGRGQVLVSKIVDMAGSKIGLFEFDPTLAMAPSSSLVVYFVADTGEIVSDQTEVTFEPEVLANPLTVTLSETRLKPRQELTLTITTAENSQVSLSSVDQNVLLENQGNDLSRNKVYNALRLYDNAGDADLDSSYRESYSNLLKSGTLVMTDAMKFKDNAVVFNNITTVRRDVNNYDYSADTQSNIVIPLQPACSYFNLTDQEQLDLQNTTSVRSKFDDTLLWQDIEYGSRMTTIKTVVPETVTSWVLTGYSLSATNGLGFIQTPLVVTTFKPFFTDVRMLCSCKMGEVADVQVTIHNYMDQTSRVEVTLDDSAGDFEILPSGRAFGDYDTYDEDYVLRNLKQTTVQVAGEGVRTTTYRVLLKKVGPMRLKVQTISSVACDTVEKTIMVDPPGKTITRTVQRTIVLAPFNPPPGSIVFEINVPPNAVPGSTKVQFSVQGDKFSLELVNQKPLSTGDGDVLASLIAQGVNLFGTSPHSGCKSPTAALDFMNAVVKFLKGQCPDGGFRIDGDCDLPLRDTTYTASTLMATATSVQYYLADRNSLVKGLQWLASIQRADGSFPNPISYPSAIYVEGPITTAYVLYSILNCDKKIPGIKTPHVATLNKAMDSLFAQVDSLDILSLALLSLSARAMQDARKSVAFARLDRLSSKNEYTQRWSGSVLLDEAYSYIYELYEGETDMIAFFRVANGMTQYLVENTDRMSSSTRNQMTAKSDDFTVFYYISNYQMQMSFSSANSSSGMTTVVMDSNNRNIMSTFEMDANTKMINVMATGTGLATMEMTYEYNLMPEDIVDAYSLHLNLTAAMSREWQLNICVSSKQTPNPTGSVMEIKFPPGFNTTEFIKDQDAMTPKITKKDLKGDSLTVTFENLDDKPACFVVPLYRATFVEQPLVGTVTIQDKDLKNEKPHISSAEFTLSSFDSSEVVETAVLKRNDDFLNLI